MNRVKLPPYQRQKSSTGGFYGRPCPPNCSNMTTKTPKVPQQFLPNGMIPLDNQVAGHAFLAGTDALGMLKDQYDGSVLKPAGKQICGEREVAFYETLKKTSDPCLIFLRELVPEYKGNVKMKIGERNVDFIKLSDVTQGMLEPCIMDIKIGKRTWDPLATAEKIATEEEKYAACKQTLGFCIPGFQIHSLTTGKVRRYGKEYGKKLNEKTLKDTLKIFLNADIEMSRPLLMQLLSGLWSVQKWSRMQKYYKLYSSSLLLVYDARKLRNSLQYTKKNSNSPNGSISPKAQTSPSINDTSQRNPQSNWCYEPVQSYRKVQRSHSAQNNYDEDVKTIRENYVFMLDNLIGAYEDNKEWAYVKMIDFAHAFRSDDDSIDTNYSFGVDNLVKIFEEFLKECD